MSYTLLYLALFVAFLDWIAVARGWKWLEYIAKPGVMVLLLIWLGVSAGFGGQLVWFAAGLAFSMLGDIFLMLPREQFIAGLVAFLVAHLAYLVGFNASLPPVNLASLAIALAVGLAAGQLYRRISAGLRARGEGKLLTPVLVYSGVISLMLLSALLTLVRSNLEWMPGPALLVSLGALLFFASDSFLAWNKFVAPLPYGRLRVIVTYHLGQALIALGALLHVLTPL